MNLKQVSKMKTTRGKTRLGQSIAAERFVVSARGGRPGPPVRQPRPISSGSTSPHLCHREEMAIAPYIY
jgi:hypothetical protein